MKHYIALFLITLLFCISCNLQKSHDQNYTETKNSEKTNSLNWQNKVEKAQLVFASSNIRYPKETVPESDLSDTWKAKAWKGEKIHTQLLYFSNKDVKKLKISPTTLRNNKTGEIIPENAISLNFVRYVKTDVFAGGCGVKETQKIDSSLVEDPIDIVSTLPYQKYTTQPLWLSIQVPEYTKSGIYNGTINIQGDKKQSLSFEIEIVNKTLPTPEKWTFDLDLWQHPYAIARVHNVQPWSDAHFDWMKKYYTMLAKAGQKVITASIINEAWNHQTYDDYPSLITWIKHENGTWSYDYTLFDKYIQFVMDCGINQRINCYSMIPWKIEFEYFDEASKQNKHLTDKPGSKAYNEFWGLMLKDFRKHLIEKSWFDKTAIAMDERNLNDMLAVIKLIKGIDPDFNISLAGEFHKEIEPYIADYCIASRWQFPAEILSKRKKLNQPSTVYTCCTEEYPNGFTFSPPAENAWLPWYTAAKGFTGYVRWAYNSWVQYPLLDSRFITWPGGDTYQVYPGPRTSIRFEKLIEGIQDFEKIKILRETFKAENQIDKLKKLDEILKNFDLSNFPLKSAQQTLESAKTNLENL